MRPRVYLTKGEQVRILVEDEAGNRVRINLYDGIYSGLVVHIEHQAGEAVTLEIDKEAEDWRLSGSDWEKVKCALTVTRLASQLESLWASAEGDLDPLVIAVKDPEVPEGGSTTTPSVYYRVTGARLARGAIPLVVLELGKLT